MAEKEAADGGREPVTLTDWVRRRGYSDSMVTHLRRKKGFPDPVGHRDVPKRRDPTPMPAGRDPGLGVTVDEFAALIGASAGQVRRVTRVHTDPLPERIDPGERVSYPIQGRRRLDDLLSWWNRRPAPTTRVAVYDPDQLAPFAPGPPSLPPLESLGVDPGKEVSLTGFATILGEDHGTVTQYRTRYPHTMPPTADGRRVQDLEPWEHAPFRFGDLYRWWGSRPGRGRPYDTADPGGDGGPEQAAPQQDTPEPHPR